MTLAQQARYDLIGQNYASRRGEDPLLRGRIMQALGDAATIVNVGAGAGSYEPRDRKVLPVEPSSVMVAQRPKDLSPAIRGTADQLPLHDKSVDAAMTILSLHHWHPGQEAGVREMLRVARQRIVIVTIDPEVWAQMWLVEEYFPEVAALDRKIFPAPEAIAAWIGGKVEVETVPIRRDTPDGTLMAFWAHPERVLDPVARGATSGFARQPEDVVQRVVAAVTRDLDSGRWDARHGSLRSLPELDAGLRLIIGTLKE